jgi:hypothetical protein
VTLPFSLATAPSSMSKNPPDNNNIPATILSPRAKYSPAPIQKVKARIVNVLGLTLLNNLAIGLTQFVSVSFFLLSNTYHHWDILNISFQESFNILKNIIDVTTGRRS